MKSENRPKNRHSLRHDRHSVSLQTDHLVFCTKYQAKILTPEISIRCEEIIHAVAKELNIKIRRMAVNLDHVHIFYVYPPKLSTSYIAQKFKGVSSRRLRREFPELQRHIKDHLWAPSNYHGSVGQGFEVVESYIKTQRRDGE